MAVFLYVQRVEASFSLHYEALKQRANVLCVLIARTSKMIRWFPSAADHIVTIGRWDDLIGKHEF